MDFGDNANVYNVFTSYNLCEIKSDQARKKERERAMGSYRGAPFVDRKFVRFYVMINRLTYIVMCVYDINQRLCRSIILYPVSV